MVYIIDDDESLLDAMDVLMRVAGFDALKFSSATEFLERVTPSSQDCLILDLCMPGMDGFDLLQILSARGTYVPVIVLSALDDAQSRERVREMGAKGYFKKPVDDQALIDMIHGNSEKTKGARGAHLIEADRIENSSDTPAEEVSARAVLFAVSALTNT